MQPFKQDLSQINPTDMKMVEYDFDKVDNFKEFFIKCDGISKAGNETFISVFRRYRCEAGCEMCYIQDRWVDKNGHNYFHKYVPEEINDEMVARIEDAFDHFQIVSTIDDLYLVKNKYPNLFEFYKYISHRINLTSMTDMAFIQQTPIALDYLDFVSMYDITFSDRFLQKPAVYKAVMANINRLRERYPLVKLRFIVSSDPTIDKTNLVALINWAKDNGIYTSGTLDNQGDWYFTTKIMDMFDHRESAYMMYNQELHQIYTEVTHLMLDRWVVSFYQSTQDEDQSFYQLTEKFKPDLWLECLLKQKLKQYNKSRIIMERNESNAKYFDFFEYIADNVTVNEGWNFIPDIMFDPRSYIYRHKLLQNGFIETPVGIIREGPISSVIPIYSFKK